MILTALDRVLAATAVELDAFAVCDVAADAQILIPRLTDIEVHFVLLGTLHLQVERARPIALGPGSIVVVPPGRSQRLAASAAPARDFPSDAICSTRADGLQLYDAAETCEAALRVMCAQIRADMADGFGLFDKLAQPIAATLDRVAIVRASVEALSAEADAPGAFSKSLTGALMKACLALALRNHVATKGTADLPGLFSSNWLARAVGAILENPEASYSVESLAAISGRSRSTFAKGFAAELGVPPMEFVFQARLARAHMLLTQGAAPIAEIAARAGFANRSHFSRMFRETYGTDPRSYRRSGRADGAIHV